MGIKTKILLLLEQGPATTRDLCREVYGHENHPQMHTMSSRLSQFRQMGVVRSKRYGAGNLWSIA